MSLGVRRELLSALKDDYEKANYKQRKKILDSLVAATGYNRKYANTLLTRSKTRTTSKRTRLAKYDSAVKDCLLQVWRAAGYICSKRLIPFLPEFLPILERTGYLPISSNIREKLLQLSPATADRLLKLERKRLGKGISTTRAGNLLRQQIAVRSFADWDNLQPGFFEVDLVAHNGGQIRGQCVHTFTLTDIASGWTEMQALLNKGEDEVLAAMPRVRRLLPIEILGFDSDNGSEFINYKVAQYCEAERITFTRSREYKKNDQAFVEEKNGSVVRRLVGYKRLEGKLACDLLSSLYRAARLYVNYFQPSLKLASKTRLAGRVTKKYHSAKTPCQRLLEADIPEPQKARLRRMFSTLDPIALLGRIELIQSELIEFTKPAQNPDFQEIVAIQPESLATPSNQSSPAPSLLSMPSTRSEPRKYYIPKPPELHRRRGRKNLVPQHLVQEIYALLSANPSLTAIKVINALNKAHPGSFSKKNKGTIERIIRQWRTAHPEYFNLYPGAYKYKNKGCKGLIINESTTM